MVRLDATLLPHLESVGVNANYQLELLCPGPITMATMGQLDTCLVLLRKVNPGCIMCRACRDTERVKTESQESALQMFSCEAGEIRTLS